MIKRNILRLMLPLAVALSVSSCYYDKYDELYAGTPGCSSANFKYSADIKPIFTSYCVNCHGPSLASGGYKFDTYESASAHAKSGILVKAIHGADGLQKMPQGGTLDSCQIKQIENWVAAGAPNN